MLFCLYIFQFLKSSKNYSIRIQEKISNLIVSLSQSHFKLKKKVKRLQEPKSYHHIFLNILKPPLLFDLIIIHRISQLLFKIMTLDQRQSHQQYRKVEEAINGPQLIETQYLLIDQYLDLTPIKTSKQAPFSNEILPTNSIHIQSHTQMIPSPTQHFLRRKTSKSVFHNFQKHLITLLKKFIHFTKFNLSLEPQGAIAYNLWIFFKQSSVNSKKILNFIFGVQSSKKQRIYDKLSSLDNVNFTNLIQKYTLEEITRAQEILRQRTIAQAKYISKNFIKSNSNVINFDQFYQYFTKFIMELESGPLAQRMRKCGNKMLAINSLSHQ